jgi:lysozyme family protein
MADFTNAFQLMLAHEGGYGIDPDDPGGETYKGVSRKNWSKWDGWMKIDRAKRQSGFPASLDKDVELQEDVKAFYLVNFWNRIKGDDILEQKVAESIFDFGVNAGVGSSISIAQMVVGTDPDGVIGKESIAKINAFDREHFIAAFTIGKIARYINIVKKRPSSQKYFYGWVRRALGENS